MMKNVWKNGWLAFALLAAACAGAVARPIVIPPASAGPGKRCDWRYIKDSNYPEVPEGTGADSMSAEWVAVGQAGYRLVAVNSNSDSYLFERCTE